MGAMIGNPVVLPLDIIKNQADYNSEEELFAFPITIVIQL